MIALIQRVTHAAVDVGGQQVARIDTGILALIGVLPTDQESNARALLEKLLKYRIFSDDAGKMNLSLQAIGGALLLVPQFTLAADTAHGLRPSFAGAAAPALGARLFDYLAVSARAAHAHVGTGVFGANMQVSLVNDGPATFWLEA